MSIVAGLEPSEVGLAVPPDRAATDGQEQPEIGKRMPQSGLPVEGDRMLERTKKGMVARLRLAANWRQINGPLFRKYVALFLAVVFIVLLTNVLFEVAFSYQEQRAALIRIQREQAEAAATKIGQFIKEIESQVGWTTQLP